MFVYNCDNILSKYHAKCHLGPKKSRFSGPTPSKAPSNDVAALKTIKYKCHKNNRYIGSFMYPSAVVVCCCVLLCVVCKRGGEVSLHLCCVSCEEVLRGWGVVGRPPPPTIL
jgi:hypothetical protein